MNFCQKMIPPNVMVSEENRIIENHLMSNCYSNLKWDVYKIIRETAEFNILPELQQFNNEMRDWDKQALF